MEAWDIVDSQIHLFLTMGIEAALAAMDSIGIQGAIIDEYRGPDENGAPKPCITLPGGHHRPISPGAQMASLLHPERFCYVQRVHAHDPDLADVIRLSRADPACRGLRAEARADAELTGLRNGAYRQVFAQAANHALPLCVLIPGHVELLEPSIAEFSACRFVIDHIGMPATPEGFAYVLGLSKYANVSLKWCHPHRTFPDAPYPFVSAVEGLQRAIEAYGRERIMWASDFTAVRTGHRWADTLFYLRDSDRISREDKDWILGGTARRLFDWPRPATLATPLLVKH